jgi:hypothetical protein
MSAREFESHSHRNSNQAEGSTHGEGTRQAHRCQAHRPGGCRSTGKVKFYRQRANKTLGSLLLTQLRYEHDDILHNE